jgi:hypothetical protein
VPRQRHSYRWALSVPTFVDQTKNFFLVQSLVIPFAFLIHNQLDTVLSLLEQTDIQGRSALDILIQTWCENAEIFQGFWPSRISHLALSQLYLSERPSLQNLIVKGDIIMKPETKNGTFPFLFLSLKSVSSVI